MKNRTLTLALHILLASYFSSVNARTTMTMPSVKLSPTFMEGEDKEIAFIDHVASGKEAKNPLFLREVMESVARTYPSLLSARAQIEASENDRLSSYGNFDPNLKGKYKSTQLGDYENQTMDFSLEQRLRPFGATLFGGYQNGIGRFPVYEGKLDSNEYGAIYGGVRVPLMKDRSVDSARTQLTIRDIQVGSAMVQAQNVLNQAVWMAKKKYWDWVGSGLKVKVMINLLKLAEMRDSYFKTRFEKGDIPKLTWIDNQRMIQQRKIQVNLAKRTQQKNAIELSMYLRNVDGSIGTLSENRLPEYVEPPKQEQMREFAEPWSFDQHPEVQEISRAIQENIAEQTLTNNQLLPKLDIELGSKRELGEGAYKNRTDLSVGGILEVPLFFRQARGKLASLKAKQVAFQQKEKLIRDSLSSQAKDAWLAMDLYFQVYIDAKNEAVAAQQVEDGERMKFTSGDSDLLTVNIREQASADAILREIDAVIQYYQAKAALESALIPSS